MAPLSLGDLAVQAESILDNSRQPVYFPDVCSAVGNDRMIFLVSEYWSAQ